MSDIIEQVKRAIIENPERPNSAGLAVVDAEIERDRTAKWNRMVEAAKSIEPKDPNS
tara:strand:+ start:839 stop:1009 length:171 start_codon:yes stop_codon:yes gene_type:complete